VAKVGKPCLTRWPAMVSVGNRSNALIMFLMGLRTKISEAVTAAPRIWGTKSQGHVRERPPWTIFLQSFTPVQVAMHNKIVRQCCAPLMKFSDFRRSYRPRETRVATPSAHWRAKETIVAVSRAFKTFVVRCYVGLLRGA
jgi:hypothetical protein